MTLKHISNDKTTTLAIAVWILSVPFPRNGRSTTSLFSEAVAWLWLYAQCWNLCQIKALGLRFLLVSITQNDQTDTFLSFSSEPGSHLSFLCTDTRTRFNTKEARTGQKLVADILSFDDKILINVSILIFFFSLIDRQNTQGGQKYDERFLI